jgi:dephospho-CoA kinase
MSRSALKQRRRTPHPWPFTLIGLTGSIAMGKSTVATMIRRMKIPVFDADRAVHQLLGVDGAAVPLIAACFPGAVNAAGVDRRKLGQLVFEDAKALQDLEAILHPLVKHKRDKFLQTNAIRRVGVVVLDVPLLFETGGDQRCDAVFVVSAPKAIQRQRVLSREGMTDSKLRGILNRQMPDVQKRRLASAVIPSGLGYHVTLRKLRAALSDCPVRLHGPPSSRRSVSDA